MSAEVEGLRPNGPDHKLKIFSMNDTAGDISFSNMQMSTMYRGLDGNPPNCIAFKAVFGSQNRILEPNRDQRNAAIMFLDPSRTYFWKATWSGEFRLTVADGGVNGNTIYNLGFTIAWRIVQSRVRMARDDVVQVRHRCRNISGSDLSPSVDWEQAAPDHSRQRPGLRR